MQSASTGMRGLMYLSHKDGSFLHVGLYLFLRHDSSLSHSEFVPNRHMLGNDRQSFNPYPSSYFAIP